MNQHVKRRLAAVQPWWLVVAGLVLFTASGWLWWQRIYTDPSRVFWGMISDSLQTSAVTRQISQGGKDLSLQQTMILQYGAVNSVLNKTELKQPDTQVTTEQIGLPAKEYIRYTTLKSSRQAPDGKPADFSKVINKWAKSEVGSGNKQPTSLFEQSALGLVGGNFVPLANLSQRDHDSLMKLARDGQVYNFHVGTVDKKTVSNRPVYVYQVDINAVGYAALQKTLARMLGSKVLDSVDPKQYQNQDAAKVELTVDVWSRQLRQVKLNSQSRTEQYSSYGVARPVKEPQTSLTAQQLENLVKAVK